MATASDGVNSKYPQGVSRRCEAMNTVFRTMTDTLRTQLQIEVKTLNSKLFGRSLISSTVKESDDIDTTLREIMNRLGSKNFTVVQETFEKFREAVNEITSKDHLAKEMSDNLDTELKERQKEATQEDSAINSTDIAGIEEEIKQPDVAQPTDGESRKYEVMQDLRLSEQPIKVQKEILEIDLKEKTKELKQSEQERKMAQKFLSDRTSALKNKQQEIDKLYNEIEELHALYNEKKEEYEEIYKELIQAQKTIVLLDKPVKQVFHSAVLDSERQMHKTDAERSEHDKLEEEIAKYRQEATKQKERFEHKLEQKEKEVEEYKKEALQHQKQTKMVQEKAEKELKQKDYQISQLKQEAARFKISTEKTEEKLKEQIKETAHYRQMYEENEPLFK